MLILLFLCIFVPACATSPPVPSDPKQPPKVATLELEKSGVQVVSLRLTAADHMIDFRYRVVDPQKAAPLLDRRIKPYLIEIKSGVRLEVPRHSKLGPVRQISDDPAAGRVYNMLFGNARKIVKHGGRVTIVIGEIRLENLLVE